MTDVVRDVMDFFPLEIPRPNQEKVIRGIIKAFNDGFKTVLLEAPVGSGKSAIAMTLAGYLGSAHILTPRKSLQDQYYSDFHKDLVLMKGRSSYPCFPNVDSGNEKLIYGISRAPKDLTYIQAIDSIAKGKTPTFSGLSCSEGPCTKDKSGERRVYKDCAEVKDNYSNRPCPYRYAIDIANQNRVIVHNLHSFIFQTAFAGWFIEKDLLVVDECHDMEDIVRDLLTKKMTIRKAVTPELNVPTTTESITPWVDFFLRSDIAPPEHSMDREDYLEAVEALMDSGMKNFVVDIDYDPQKESTKFTFIPKNIGNAAEALIMRYGSRRLLMSGTIYSKEYFCQRNGLDPDETAFIRIGSSFPVHRRPIIMKPDYLTDNSHEGLKENFSLMIENVHTIMDKCSDVRGLIHSPSYYMSDQIAHALHSDRIITHKPETFISKLDYFLNESKPNSVFISPVCQQGVDLKDDRARFQIIVRIPYLNSSDPLVKAMLEEKNFTWYNYKALIAFGQMLGRVMRSDNDHGVTILLDSRFKGFINRNKKFLPIDVLQSIKTK